MQTATVAYTPPVRDAAETRLQRVKLSLMRNDHFAFWRGLMMVGKTEIDDNFPTAATDGCDEVYGRALLMSQNDKQIAFIVIHENWHKAGRDLTVWAKLFKIDPQVANMACDYHHNLCIMDMDPTGQYVEFPTNPDGSRMGLYDERFRGVDIPAIFRILRQEKQDGTGPFAPGKGDPTGNTFDEHRWQEAQGRDEEERDAIDKDIDQALRQGKAEHEKLNGKGNGSMALELGELLKPKIDWRKELANFFRSACMGADETTWRRPNRRFVGMDILLPSTYTEKVGKVGYAADMSGSVTDPMRNAMLSELHYLATETRPEKLEVFYWDSHVARHETYDEDNLDLLLTSTKPVGGGGTSPSCVKQFVRDKRIELECMIILTDGYVFNDWPEFDCPTLWIITTKGITAPTGITIHMDDI